jgi:signal transduction histidine kinase
LSLLSRYAGRHAENAEFRADMIATLKGSVGKMNDLLARLSPQAQARSSRTQPQPLRAILSSAIAAKRRDHDVRLTGDSGLWVMADAPALEQAVGPLLQNAVEASAPDAPVLVRVEAQGEEVAVTVTDHGCGMDADFIQGRLFQPFVSTKAGGFGIGSFEARSLIAAMGGRLAVDSAPGRGTSFTITLPAAEAAGADQRKIA